MKKPIIELSGILLQPREVIYDQISDVVRSRFGTEVVLTGIKDESRSETYSRDSTYGVPLQHMKNFRSSNDLLDYALNTVIVYDNRKLSLTENDDFAVMNPVEAVMGFLKLGWGLR